MKKYKLGDYLTMIRNGAIIQQKKGARGIPITRIETLSNNMFNRNRLGYADVTDSEPYKDYILEDKDLIMSHINSRQFLGRTVLYQKRENEEIIHGMNVLRIQTNSKLLNPVYAYYLFNTAYFKKLIDCIRKDAINQSSLSIADIKNIELYIPDISLQKNIVSILYTLDRKIALNRAINDNLEAMAKQLYDYWFVQFDFPDANGKPYKSSGGKMVWNEKLKREIPEGWEVAKVKDVALTYSGGTPTSTNRDYYDEGNIPWVNSGDLNSPIITSTSYYITEKGLNSSSAKLYPPKTILVALYGATAGKVSLLSFEACSNQAVCGVISKENVMTTYIRYYLTSLYEHFITLSSGSARDNISQDTIKNIALSIPQHELLKNYSEIVNPIINKIIANQHELETLTKLRNELLPLLMNGQVKVGVERSRLNNDLSHY